MSEKLHSVTLEHDKCIGCTNCIKRCPTEAIRVRNGKAMIINDLCIDCGLCIKVCRNHAKKATTSPLAVINNFEYKVAIPAPSIYAQFKKIHDVNVILTGIKRMGFDEVFEVSHAAQMVTEYTRRFVASEKGEDIERPIISSACPAVVRLIITRFPSLIPNILPVLAPVEVAAIAAKDYLEKQGINRSDIGVFFISPCAAKNTYIEKPLGIQKSEVDAVISMQDIYMQLRHKISRLENVEILSSSNAHGVDWALTGGESKGTNFDNAINVDGVENVIKVLEELENGQLEGVDFIEGLACTGGCVGGPLTVFNSFVAKNRLLRVQRRISELPSDQRRNVDFSFDKINFEFTESLKPNNAMSLGEDVSAALKKMEAVEALFAKLPLTDCGSCGAPTCYALAEDVIRGDSNEEDCVFLLRKKVHTLAEAMLDLSSKIPQTSAHDQR